MKNFHAVLIDEARCEFGVSLRAEDHSSARDQLREDYPESRVDQLETTEEVQARESTINFEPSP